MKRNQSSDSLVSIKGDVNIGGDGAIGSNAKIVKTNEKKGLSLFEILIGLVTLIAGIIEIYKYCTGK